MFEPDDRQLLERRAAALAQSPTEDGTVETVAIVTVTVCRRRYALEARHITRILPTAHVCRLPEDGGELIGLVVAGGAAVPVADLGSLLMLSGPDRSRPFVVMLEAAGQWLGLLVDEVESFGNVVEAARVAPASVPGETVPEQTEPLEHGFTDDEVVVLDADALLAHPGLAGSTRRDRS